MFAKLNHRLASGTLPYGARLAFIAIALINLPGAIIAGIFFWTILPLPALVLYGFVLAFAFGKSSVDKAEIVIIHAVGYHLILLCLLAFQFVETAGLGGGERLWAQLTMITYVAGPMGLYMLAFRSLRETANAEKDA